MKTDKQVQRRAYEYLTKLLEDGSITPLRVLSAYDEAQDALTNMLFGACQAIADYTRKMDGAGNGDTTERKER